MVLTSIQKQRKSLSAARSFLGCSNKSKPRRSDAMKPFVRTLRTGRTHPLPQVVLTATSFIFSAVAALVVISALAAFAGSPVSGAGAPVNPWNKNAKKTMRAFGSEEELKNYFRQLAEAAKKEMAKRR